MSTPATHFVAHVDRTAADARHRAEYEAYRVQRMRDAGRWTGLLRVAGGLYALAMALAMRRVRAPFVPPLIVGLGFVIAVDVALAAAFSGGIGSLYVTVVFSNRSC